MAPIPEVVPNELSHYTTIAGFQSILTKRELWLSNVSFMNDKLELIHGLRVASTVISKMIKSSAFEQDKRRLLKEVISELKTRAVPNTYAACFCKNDDLLSQWRGYSGGQQGISITFGGHALRVFAASNSGTLVSVVYDRDRAANRFQRLFEQHVKETEGYQQFEDLLGIEDPSAQKEKMFQAVSQLVPRFKDDGFAEENEWRLVIQGDPKDLQFRTGDGILIPYLIAHTGGLLLPVRHVTVGPGKNQDLAIKGVELFLEKDGYGGIEVKPSKIPYRQ
ncbi:DUF2971 domain-containing protein [Rhizobium sp. PL01]|uniref:DUF2971 domain-containing protein n=1 Tax=Rhizobium sp. PL01 TaxID=3085631 RepID=UPI0029829336|nr:DUF2971 domain-containing protein [Rhizobium sp. PL01]MDW5315519.1 DUF2971 domain-containing protein [Rhizobium sp. PL01]